jgi:hypothetical protein
MKFKILYNGGMITEKTILKSKNGDVKLTTEFDLCKFLYSQWKKATDSTSFQNWADELNEDENFDGEFTILDALDNLASNSVLNINGKAIDLYKFFQEHFPNSLQSA